MKLALISSAVLWIDLEVWARAWETPPQTRLVYRESKFFFVGSYRREVIYSVVALNFDEAWKCFKSSPQSAEEIISIIKTETEIYLAQ